MTSPTAASRKLEDLAEHDQELAPYARLLGIALAAAEDDVWAIEIPQAEAHLREGKPALHGALLALRRASVEALYAQLSAAAHASASAEGREGAIATSDLLDALQQALEMRAEEGTPDTVLQLTLLPIFHAARKEAAAALADVTWTSGMCPICAAWPALAESRGLDRVRALRCGRCGSDWKLPWQLCPFCANGDHASLSYLVSEELGESRRVFTCNRCHCYLKTLATLSAVDPLAVPVEDLVTLELDLAALDAGFQRPAEPGYRLQTDLRWT